MSRTTFAVGHVKPGHEPMIVVCACCIPGDATIMPRAHHETICEDCRRTYFPDTENPADDAPKARGES